MKLRHEFWAMGTSVALIGPARRLPDDAEAFASLGRAVESVFADQDRRFSRFRPDSELSCVNREGGDWMRVSSDFAEVTRLSLAAANETGGLFDPTTLGALVAAGYDRDWAEIHAHGAVIQEPPPPGGHWREIDLRGRLIRVAHGVGIDFGGVAKGWTVDRAAETAAKSLPCAVVNAGGDLRLVGSPSGGGLDVGVEDPWDPARDLLRLRLECGALATSSVPSRSWGDGRHQIIDPRTGRPAATSVVQATMWAPTCAEAEIRSTWAVLAGPPILDRLPGVLVMDDGRILLNLEGIGTDLEETAEASG